MAMDRGEEAGKDNQSAIGTVVSGTLIEEPASKTMGCKKCTIASILAVVVIIVVTAVLIPIITGDNPKEQSVPVPASNLNESAHDKRDFSLVPNMTEATIQAILEDPDSPQSLAFDWILKDPNWDTYEDWRKQQVYALACLYNSIPPAGNAAWRIFQLLNVMNHHVPECKWQPNTAICPQGDGIVRQLVLVANANQKGYLPPEIALLSHLERIDLHGADLNPSLEDFLPLTPPNGLVALKELKELRITDWGNLFGNIPSTLGLLTTLTSLELSDTKLSSEIPSELGLLTNLTSLILSSNDLIGTVPEEIGDLKSLTTLDIKDNPNLDASVPSGFCTYEHLPMESLLTDWCSGVDECCVDAE